MVGDCCLIPSSSISIGDDVHKLLLITSEANSWVALAEFRNSAIPPRPANKTPPSPSRNDFCKYWNMQLLCLSVRS